MDLSKKDLRNTNLARANISGVNFTGADFTGANLTGAKFDDEVVIEGDKTVASFRSATGINLVFGGYCVTDYPEPGRVQGCKPLPDEVLKNLICDAPELESKGSVCAKPPVYVSLPSTAKDDVPI